VGTGANDPSCIYDMSNKHCISDLSRTVIRWYQGVGRAVFCIPNGQPASAQIEPRTRPIHLVWSLTAVAGTGLFLAATYPNLTFERIAWAIAPLLLCCAIVEMVGAGAVLRWMPSVHTFFEKRPGLRSPLAVATIFVIVATVLNLSVLFEVWSKGIGHPFFHIGGLLPYSDASNYMCGAEHLTEFGTLDAWNNGRRPLPICLYAVLLKLSGHSVQITVLLSTLLCSVSIALAALAVYEFAGITAGIVMALLVSGFVAPFIGTMLTEPFGLVFGNLAFVFLFRGFVRHDLRKALFGLFLLGLAWGMRAGPFAAVGLLVVLVGVYFRRRMRLRVGAIIAAVAVSAFSLWLGSGILMAVGSGGKGAVMTNAPLTLYGIVKGGAGWQQIYADHPELSKCGASEQAELAYRYVREELLRDPKPLIRYVATTIRQGVIHPFQSAFPFAVLGFPREVLVLPFLLALCALPAAGSQSGKTVWWLLSAGMLGNLISLPVCADAGYRAYATTCQMQCAMAALGVGVCLRILSRYASGRSASFIETRGVSSEAVGLPFAVVLVAVLFVGTMAVKFSSPREHPVGWGSLEPGVKTFALRWPARCAIRIVQDDSATSVPDVSIGAYRRNNPSVCMYNPVFASVPAGSILAEAFDIHSRGSVYLLFDREIQAEKRGVTFVEGRMLGGYDGHNLYQATIVGHMNDN